jgi:hypothetical protein
MRVAGYEFSEGARFQPGEHPEAKEVGAHLDLLLKQNKGELTPKDVVDDARNSNSPLHSFFEWDDSAAAEEYRLQQARGLIRSVVAIYTRPDAPAVRTKAMVHINEPGAPHYREAVQAMSASKTRKMVLQRAWSELQSWKKRYADLKEFSELVPVIDEVGEKLSKKIGAH